MSDTFTDIEQAIYGRLTGTAGTALYGTRVYADQAPLGAALPYVVFQHVAGGDLNVSPSRVVDVDYQIECVALDLSEARQGAGYVEAAFHNQRFNAPNWNLIACTQKDLFRSVEEAEGKQYWRRGATYRFRVSK